MSIEAKIEELTSAVRDLTAAIKNTATTESSGKPATQTGVAKQAVTKPVKETAKTGQGEKPVEKPTKEDDVDVDVVTIAELLAADKRLEAFDILRIQFLSLCKEEGKDQLAIAAMNSYKPNGGKLSGVAEDKWQELYDKFVEIANS